MKVVERAAAVATLAELGELLRLLRRRQARQRAAPVRTYRELALRMGWSHGLVGGYLTGKILPPVDRFDELVRELGATNAELGALARARDRAEERRSGHQAPGRPGAPVRPRQLPADVAAFSGRAAALGELGRSRGPEPAGSVIISAVSGTAGVGKTALAVHWAHRAAADFPDGQLYVNLRGFSPGEPPMAPGEAVRGFLAALGVPSLRLPPGLDAQVGLYRSLLADRRILVVLDNAADAAQVRPLLPGAPGCLALITSRDRLTSLVAVENARLLTLDVLTDREAHRLLAARLGAARLAADPAATEAVVAACAGLPLALAIAAARLVAEPGLTTAGLARELTDARRRLPALSAGDASADIRSVFETSYRRLAPASGRLFRLLGLHPGSDVGLSAAAALAGLTRGGAEAALAELVRAQLLVEQPPGRYAMHDLLRAYAMELAEEDSERPAAEARLLDHYVHTAHAAARLFNPVRVPPAPDAGTPGADPEVLADGPAAVRWFTDQAHLMVALLGWAAGLGRDAHVVSLARSLTDFLHRQGHWQLAAEVHGLALAAGERLADPAAQAHAHRHLGRSGYRLGDPATERHLRLALGLYHEAGDRVGAAHTHHDVGGLHERAGRHRDALREVTDALELYRAAGDAAGQARALNAIGWYRAKLGEFEAAVASCRQVLGLQQELGDHVEAASTWDTIGYAQQGLGAFAEAAESYAEAVRLFRLAGERYGEALVLTHVGDLRQAAGDARGARTAWREAWQTLDELGHPEAEEVRVKLSQPG